MLIKFKSVLLVNEPDKRLYPDNWEGDSNLDNNINIFNKYFKGKYVWLLNDSFVVPFEEDMKEGDETRGLKLNEFNDMSKLSITDTESELINHEKIFFELVDFLDDGIYNPVFIDIVNTEKCQSVGRWIGFNSFEPDEDITIEELKVFRTWLAAQLYNIFKSKTDIKDIDEHEKTLSMLEYYANGMNDNATLLIEKFADSSYNVMPKTNNCACTSSFDITTTNVNSCDILMTYRNNMHEFMVSKFSDVKFWLASSEDSLFILDVIKYINGIIKYDFPFNAIDKSFGYGDCSCLNSQNSLQESAIELLKQLKQSFEYISEGEQDHHKNFIYNILLKWSDILYEQMLWV